MLNHLSVLPQLGIKLRDDSRLPTVVDCPICYRPESLSLLHDPSSSSPWVSCQGCGFAGELLELAARAWHLDERTTARRLKQLNVIDNTVSDSDLAKYLHQNIATRQSTRELWKVASRTTVDATDVVVPKYSKLKLTPTDFEYGLFGVCSYQDLLHHLPEQFSDAVDTNKLDESERVVVVPLYDMPSRICGFHCTNMNTGQAFLVSVLKGDRYAGLTSFRDISMSDASPHRKLLVMADPLLAVWTQIRKLRKKLEYLPLVGTVFDSSHDTLFNPSGVPGDSISMWSFHVSPSLLKATIRSGTSMYISESEDPSIRLITHKTASWVRHVQSRSQMWQYEFGKWVGRHSNEQVSSIVAAMGWTKSEVHSLARKLTPAAARVLLASIPDEHPACKVVVGKHSYVIEDQDGWSLSDTAEQIINAKLVIDEICQMIPSNDQWYRGRILVDDTEVPFFDDSLTIEKNTPRWMQQVLMASDKKSYPIICAPRWKTKLVYLAMKLRPPRVVSEVHALGWNAEMGEMVFPRFTINSVGVVRQKKAITHDLDLNFDPPDYCLPDIEHLSKVADLSSLVPISMAAVASAALVMRRDEEAKGVVVNQIIGKLLIEEKDVFGCRSYSLVKNTTSKIKTVVDEADRYNWPSVIDLSAMPAKLAVPLIEDGVFKKHIVVADPVVVSHFSKSATHETLYVQADDAIRPESLELLRRSLPHLFVHAAANNKLYRRSSLEGINAWYFELRGRNAFDIHWPEIQLDLEIDVLKYLLSQRAAVLIRKEFEVNDNWEIAECRERKMLYVKVEAVEQVLGKILQQPTKLHQLRELMQNGIAHIHTRRWHRHQASLTLFQPMV